eukprot:2640837-Amphidinium_carterae.1
MRVTEYAYSNGWDYDKVLTGADVAPRAAGQETYYFKDADEVMLWFKASKADQVKFGCARNHYRTGRVVCAVQALSELQAHWPQRFRGSEQTEPLFKWSDGSPLKREQVQAILEKAAVANGFDYRRFRTHSLRIGGATALYHVRPDIQLIQRFGRWTSSAFQAYLWESNEAVLGLSEAMARDKTTLHSHRGSWEPV